MNGGSKPQASSDNRAEDRAVNEEDIMMTKIKRSFNRPNLGPTKLDNRESKGVTEQISAPLSHPRPPPLPLPPPPPPPPPPPQSDISGGDLTQEIEFEYDEVDEPAMFSFELQPLKGDDGLDFDGNMLTPKLESPLSSKNASNFSTPPSSKQKRALPPLPPKSQMQRQQSTLGLAGDRRRRLLIARRQQSMGDLRALTKNKSAIHTDGFLQSPTTRAIRKVLAPIGLSLSSHHSRKSRSSIGSRKSKSSSASSRKSRRSLRTRGKAGGSNRSIMHEQSGREDYYSSDEDEMASFEGDSSFESGWIESDDEGDMDSIDTVSHESVSSSFMHSKRKNNRRYQPRNSLTTESSGTNNTGSSQNHPIARWLRVIVISLFVYAAVGVPISIMAVQRRYQSQRLKQECQLRSQEIADGARQKFAGALLAMDAFRVTIVSDSMVDGSSERWPNMTVRDYDYKAASFLALSGTQHTALHPVVNQTQRNEWNEYVQREFPEWIMQRGGGDNDTIPSVHDDILALDQATGKMVPANITDEPFLPGWQMHPLHSPEFVNFDLRSTEQHREPLDLVVATQGVVIGPPVFDDVSGSGLPATTIYSPVLDKLESFENANLVAVMTTKLSWSNFFHGVIAGLDLGLLIVVRNDCTDEPFTVSVDEGGATFLGMGDLSDKDNDFLRQNVDTIRITNDPKGSPGIPFNFNYCKTSFSITPSDELRQEYFTPAPFWTALSIASFFILIALATFGYDIVNRRRIRHLELTADKNDRFVSTLFPDRLRRRLQKMRARLKTTAEVANLRSALSRTLSTSSLGQSHHDPSPQPARPTRRRVSFLGSTPQSQGQTTVLGPKARLRSILNKGASITRRSSLDSGSGSSSCDEDDSNFMVVLETPVADLFPRCTILFACIDGFDDWSTNSVGNDPQMTFALLENLFTAMDRLANQRKVFKVETISDTYMAVAGLPDPQKDHAIRIAKFARDIMRSMRIVTKTLALMLGEEIKKLRLKVGIHSGQVTAGVLGGQRSRFQLFGDTVNTASRMMSTSKSNRIQMTQATAGLLIEAGRGRSWIRVRDELIEVKGKGVVQSYWLRHPGAKKEMDLSERRRERRKPKPVEGMDIVVQPTEFGDARFANQTAAPIKIDEVEDNMDDHEKFRKSIIAQLSQLGEKPPMINFATAEDNEDDEGSISSSSVSEDGCENDGNEVITAAPIEKSRRMMLRSISTMRVTLPIESRRTRLSHWIADLLESHLKNLVGSRNASIPDMAISQLQAYALEVSEQYDHGKLEHICYVVMSAMKLLKQATAATIISQNSSQVLHHDQENEDGAEEKADVIETDYFLHFVFMWTAFVQKVGSGRKKPSESLQIGRDILMSGDYAELRECIFEEGHSGASQNVKMGEMNSRCFFEKASIIMGISESKLPIDGVIVVAGLVEEKKGAVVGIDGFRNLRVLLQTANLYHMFQNWTVFIKWSERLKEIEHAEFVQGILESDPITSWHEKELEAFDLNALPLAEQLGIEAHMNCAADNRYKWCASGKRVAEIAALRIRKKAESVPPVV